MGEENALNNAKILRTNQTKAEQRLWYHLRAHRFMGLKDTLCHFPLPQPLSHQWEKGVNAVG